MCGIAGFLSTSSSGSTNSKKLQAMTNAISSRGPDAHGHWFNTSGSVGLGHRRLSIVELTDAGSQPMVSPSGRYVVVFNGEIYNHQELRAQLSASNDLNSWRGSSDTETLLAAFDVWGIHSTLNKTSGMFAFSVWDTKNEVLTLARDRFGEKPLYFGWQASETENTFLFGSELKALKQHPAFEGVIDRNSLCLLMRHAYIPAPYSIYKNIFKLLPGCCLTVSLANQSPAVTQFWSTKSMVESGLSKPFTGTPTQAVDRLETVLKNSVRQQMMADVPIGAFLSGGIDSSTIVALMQDVSKELGADPVKTFTIGFNEVHYNEAEHAKAVAHHLGTKHTELYVSSQDALEVVPKLSNLYCEPFADSSQIPTFLVSRLARSHVTVSLSGDAGDELFGGYNRYILTDKLWGRLQRFSPSLRRNISNVITQVSPSAWNGFLRPMQKLLPNSVNQVNIGEKLHKAACVLPASNSAELYLLMISQWSDPTTLVLDGVEPPTPITDAAQHADTDSFVHEMMSLDLVTYLPDDILCKVDRAAMGVGLETRVPMLDHSVAEFAWTLPQSYKLRDGVGKWPLRQVLYRYVPKQLIERPKMGFGVPIGDWLRGPLRDWAENLLSEARLQKEGYFSASLVRKTWVEHLSGKRNWQHRLWCVLMFQAWLEDQNVG